MDNALVNALPEELLDRILSETNPQTLTCLAQVSRKFHRLAASRLRYASHTHHSNEDHHHFRQLLSTLIRRPDLAAHMELVDIDDMQWEETPPVDPYEGHFPDPVPPTDLADLFCTAAQKLDVPDKDAFLTYLRKGKEAAEMALFLWLAPNLSKLVLRWMFSPSNRSICNLLHAAGEPVGDYEDAIRPLSRLHTLILTDESDVPFLPVLLRFYCLPSLRAVLVAGNPVAAPNEIPIVFEPPANTRSLPLDRAAFTYARLPFTTLRYLVISRYNLKSLTLHWADAGATFPSDAEDMLHPLKWHANTLERLALDTGGATGLPALLGLKQGSWLKALHISGQLLTGYPTYGGARGDAAAGALGPAPFLDPAQLLPGKTLEVLSLSSGTKGDAGFERFLAALATAGAGKREDFPRLRQVEVWPVDGDGYCVSSAFLEGLRGVFASWGVRLITVGEERHALDFEWYRCGRVVQLGEAR
ncbi:uncharacterized protein K452DRAFT_319365 [Aplosporella prunicola CBS 121167]|uniref:F-box domain-containing protein n=1 Tax=Aplosporella prunicola CBS 121167 TaxID=1176127 RepID=A0A6A6BBZ1_9PEZI|nr:uncharacterized protein K452DRAFT_319365 [Aplosporella prunicola CBS 121167]KAF2141128.1 hypothetical protein K452DRAFT_319365 [Aplosporella prunicola CBS 121167]